MAENTNIKLTVEAWADIVIKEWEKKIEALGIGVSQQLVDSFAHTVHTQSDGDPSRIEFAFEYYGKFVEWGVGSGVNIQDRETMIAAGLTVRKKKPWYSDVFYKQLEILRHLLAEKHARHIENMVVRNLNDKDIKV